MEALQRDELDELWRGVACLLECWQGVGLALRYAVGRRAHTRLEAYRVFILISNRERHGERTKQLSFIT
jgi:hypothetical protein